MSAMVPAELLELKMAQRFQLKPPVGTTIGIGCPYLHPHPWEVVPVLRVINSNRLQSKVRWTYKIPKSNLSHWSSPLCFLLWLSQICSLGKGETWISCACTCTRLPFGMNNNPLTHPRWNRYKDSKLWMRETKCIHDKSFRSSTAKFKSTHPTACFRSCARGPDCFTS